MYVNPTVSVVVPIYNASIYLYSCIKSILGQTFEDIEIILIDDYSSDDSLAICRELADKDPRVRVFHNERNIGQGLTRNRGIAEARGKFIGFIDSDDYIESDMYSALVNAAYDTNADIARCTFERVFSREASLVSHAACGACAAPSPDAVTILEGDDLRQYCDGYFGMLPGQNLSEGPSMSPCTAIYSLRLLHSQEIRFPSERVVNSEDLFFNLEATQAAKKLVLLDEPFYKYYARSGSTSRTYSSPVSKCRLLRSMAPEGEEYKLRLARTYLTSIKEACLRLASSDKDLATCSRIVRNLEHELNIASVLGNYPVSELPLREQIFARVARFELGLPEMFLASIDNIRTAK